MLLQTFVVPIGAPRNVNVTITSPTTVTVTWNSPVLQHQNGIIQYYIIRISNVETGLTNTHTTEITIFTFSELHPFYTYYCEVSAVTIGSGPSVNASFTTPEDGKNSDALNYWFNSFILVPSASPINLLASVLMSTSVLLTWDPPPLSDRNGIITEYNIIFIEVGSSNVQLFTTTTNKLNVSMLSPYTLYNFALSANTSVGMGPLSNYTTFHTLQDSKNSLIIITGNTCYYSSIRCSIKHHCKFCFVQVICFKLAITTFRCT